jgi:Tol biopolymer transport system component
MNRMFCQFFLITLFITTLFTGCNSLPIKIPETPFFTITSTATLTSTPEPTPTITPTPLWGDGCITFIGIGSDGSNIFIMRSNRSHVANITNNSSWNSWPRFSPDGTKIAFASNRSGKYNIYTMNTDGTNVTEITNNSAYNVSPSWSPNGKKIAFLSGPSRFSLYIYLINSDGTGLKKLTTTPYPTYGLDWSPDGTKIIYDAGPVDSMFSLDHVDIYIMNADGSEIKKLTNDKPDDIMPRWSHDGKRIAFVRSGETRDSSGNYGRDIYIMNSDGTNMALVLKGGDGPVSWSPDDTKITAESGPNSVISGADGSGPMLAIMPNNGLQDLVGDWSPYCRSN